MPCLIEIGVLVLNKNFKNFQYIFTLVIISPWKRAIPFILTIYNPLPPRMICAKYG
jgi:hypothetical protein